MSLLYKRMFEATPDGPLLNVLMQYFTWGGTCILGKDLHKSLFGFIENKIFAIRMAAFDKISRTPTGHRLRETANREGMSASEQDDVVMQAVDGFLFAGGFGTSHLVNAALNALHSCADVANGGCSVDGPHQRARMWTEDADAFLHETARLDPPVSSVTSLLDEEKEVDVYVGTHAVKIRLPANTTVQLLISEANVDPEVFGGPTHSRERALQFDIKRPSSETQAILSWNAPLSLVQMGAAPRGCLGYSLSLDIARRTVEHFRPTSEAQLEAAAGAAADVERARALANDGGTEDFMTHISYWTTLESMWAIIWIVCCCYVAVEVKTKENPHFLDKCLRWFAQFQVLAFLAMYYDIKGLFLIAVMCSGCCCVWAYAKVRAYKRNDVLPMEENAIRCAYGVVAVIVSLGVICIRQLLYDSYNLRSYLNILYAFFVPCLLLFMYVHTQLLYL